MRARALVLFSGVCFATTGTAQALGPDSASSLGIAAVRLIVGAITLVVFSWVMTRNVDELPHRRVPRTQWWIAGGGMALYGATFFAAVRSTGVAIGTVVALGSAPILTGVLAYVFRRAAPTHRWILSTAGAIVGITLIVLTGSSATVDIFGIVLALGAGLGYAIFALASKDIMSSGVRAEFAMSRVFLTGALLMSPVLLFTDNSWLFSRGGITVALWLGVVTVAIGYVAYSTGLRSLLASEATTLTLIEPVVATLLGALILVERPSQLAWVGVVIVLLSLSFGP